MQIKIPAVNAFIDDFKKAFHEKFGMQAEVSYAKPEQITEAPSIDELEQEANKLLQKLYFVELIDMNDDVKNNGIRSKSRQMEVNFARKAFCMVALNYGYSSKFIGRRIGFDHASVLMNRMVMKKLIDSNDTLAKSVFNSLTEQVNALMKNKTNNHAA